MAKIIKSKKDYEAALLEIEELMEGDPDIGSPEADELEILVLLVEDYEERTFPIEAPDPIEAIQFRMEQQNLKQRDLVPYIGSRSKVSEVLAKKRPLTLSMIRALHNGLGIPAQTLLREQETLLIEGMPVEWNRFPLREMIVRGWIQENVADIKDRAENIARRFFAGLEYHKEVIAFPRMTHGHIRAARDMDAYALLAWTTRVLTKAKENPPMTKYTQGTMDLNLMRDVARLSWSEKGPILAQEFLRKRGINLIIESHLPRTYLDGAAIMDTIEMPIIGLTIRYDRIDNFWFCLMHELAHISLHMSEDYHKFYDDLEIENEEDEYERQADHLAGEALIPDSAWKRSAASRLRSPEAAEHLAQQLGIHPAIVAGRMRHEFKAYRLLNNLIGHRQVRKHFPDVIWR